jgi:molybdenum-dependent DNA-binding transcriptional regulator ModE
MGTFSMSQVERRKLAAFARVEAGELTLKKAAELLRLSYRHAKRCLARWRAEGDAGLVHRLRGRPANRAAAARAKRLRSRVVAAYRKQYADYGPTLAAECLAEDGLPVVAETLRRWLIAAGCWTPTRSRPKHRKHRPRRARFGELLQMDGSWHDWFEGRRAWATLMVAVDDATGRVFARFFEQETLEAAQETFHRYAEQSGLPQAIYVDQASIYRPEPADEVELDEANSAANCTQFGRAMQTLGVELILARSPEAKGRVERMNQTLQDRLVKALRRAKVDSLTTANQFLEEFLPKFNARFAKSAADENDAHRSTAGCDLLRILSVEGERTLHRDWTVRWNGRRLQIPASESKRLPRLKPGAKLLVCEQRDGRIRLFVVGDVDEELAWTDVRESTRRADADRRPPAAKRKRSAGETTPARSNQGQKPAAKHPWRRRLL